MENDPDCFSPVEDDEASYLALLGPRQEAQEEDGTQRSDEPARKREIRVGV